MFIQLLNLARPGTTMHAWPHNVQHAESAPWPNWECVCQATAELKRLTSLTIGAAGAASQGALNRQQAADLLSYSAGASSHTTILVLSASEIGPPPASPKTVIYLYQLIFL